MRLGILDVGFDFSHRARPEHLRLDLQRNFVDDGQPPNDASDPYGRGLFKNPGHGTATIAILAGGLLSGMVEDANTNDYLGGAPLAEVIPVRIATSVILMRTSAFAEALDYLIAPNGDPSLRPDVVSMSMGGLASRAWAEVVNRAYEAGICLVTAAGNNFFGTPQSIVYPARFKRVIAACGIMADGRPYIRGKVPTSRMAGNYGPDSKMDTALAAYTPNMPWAEINCSDYRRHGWGRHLGRHAADCGRRGAVASEIQGATSGPTNLGKWLRRYGRPYSPAPIRAPLTAIPTSVRASSGRPRHWRSNRPGTSASPRPTMSSCRSCSVLSGVGVAAAPGTEMLEVEAFSFCSGISE